MYGRHSRTLAALLVTAALVAPGVALAAPAAAPAESPAAEAGKGAPVDLGSLKVSREQAISIAVQLFSIPKEMGEPNVNVSQSKEGAIWNLQYQTPPKKAEQVTISVGIDAQTGALLSYSRYANEPGKEQAPLSYTRAQALERANYWLDMLAPALKPSIRAVENPMGYGYYGGVNATYDFQWHRMAEGYPVRSEGVSISINARTGGLVSFNRGRSTTQSFKLPATILEQAKAEAAYRSQLPMGLQYQYYQKPGTDSGEWKLVYRPQTDGGYPMLSQDGKLIDYSGQPINLDYLQQMKLVPASDKPYQAPAKALTREEALALAKTVAGQSTEPTNANYSEQGGEQKTRSWNFTWQTEGDPKGGLYTNVSVDVERGVISGYGSWGPHQPLKAEEQPKFTESQARETAVQFIRSYRPDLAGSMMIMPSDESRNPAYKAKEGMVPRDSYYVRFVTLKNGIAVTDQQTTVNVDAMTGKVSSFWTGERTVKEPFPPATGLIKPEAAMDSFLKTQGLELSWNQFWTPPSEGKQPQQSEPQLVWAPGASLNVTAIDAKTGAPLDYEGRDLIELSKRPTDIEGHAAQREIELLWARGIFELKDGKFNPNATATGGELARWLVLARGMQPYVSYDFRGAFAGAKGGDRIAATLEQSAAAPYFGAALQNGIILPDDFSADTDPAAPVSRELFALWVVRAMGYGAVAKMPNHIEMPFADQAKIGAKYANAVALLHGLGVVKGNAEATFDPQRQLTRGEAATFLFAVASETRRY